MALLFGFLVFGPVSGQETRILYEPVPPTRPATSDTRPAKSFRLKGVLISNSTRTALVNGQRVREGDRVGGAEVLEIEQRGIRVLVGAREFSVDVGGSFVAGPSSGGVKTAAHKPARASRIQNRLAAMHPVPPPAESAPQIGAHLQHAVKSGETLSDIALRYLRDSVTMDQMMIALFQSNPQAFSNNINMLHEGAVLHIPDEIELHRRSPAMAAAEVLRQTDRWRNVSHETITVADSSHATQYGPVESGETLSAIAATVLQDGVTMNQMMIALYESNPQAFDNNINVLHEGAVLRIPDEYELPRQSPAAATAEVLRQTNAWRTGFDQHAPLTLARTDSMPPDDGLVD